MGLERGMKCGCSMLPQNKVDLSERKKNDSTKGDGKYIAVMQMQFSALLQIHMAHKGKWMHGFLSYKKNWGAKKNQNTNRANLLCSPSVNDVLLLVVFFQFCFVRRFFFQTMQTALIAHYHTAIN